MIIGVNIMRKAAADPIMAQVTTACGPKNNALAPAPIAKNTPVANATEAIIAVNPSTK